MGYVIPRLFGIFYLRAKFGNSHFSRSGDMIAKLIMCHVTLITPILGVICHQIKATENAVVENAIRSKFLGRKMQEWKKQE